MIEVALIPSGIGFENSGFSVGLAYLSKYLIGIPVFSRLVTISLPFPTIIILALSTLK
jgi:hypothetical protein